MRGGLADWLGGAARLANPAADAACDAGHNWDQDELRPVMLTATADALAYRHVPTRTHTQLHYRRLITSRAICSKSLSTVAALADPRGSTLL